MPTYFSNIQAQIIDSINKSDQEINIMLALIPHLSH